ncbi:MAG: hypothetical protein KGY53_04090 [Wenzhouxiangellaceae bacterium]|nr:hypothetical protein [Wenzhouxiangellaceae bacterium]
MLAVANSAPRCDAFRDVSAWPAGARPLTLMVISSRESRMSESIRLSTLSVSSKDLRVLKSLLGLSDEQSDRRWDIAPDSDSGDVLLVDVDSPDGAAIWPEISQHNRPAVALTKRRDFVARRLLRKPIRSQQLLRLLSELSENAQVSEQEDDWPVLPFDESSAPLPLAEHLRRHHWDQPIRMGGNYVPELVIDPGAGVWYSGASDRELARLLQRRFTEDDAQPVTSHELITHTEGLEQQSLANLKWRAGLAMSSGALHPDLAGDVRFMLPQVPLQALSDTAYSRQARVLIRAPVGIHELAEASKADRSDVAEFLNACHACGFLLLDSSARARTATA